MATVEKSSLAPPAAQRVTIDSCQHLHGLRHAHLSDPQVKLQPFQTLEVQAAEPVPLAVDGEYLGEFSRFSVRVLPAALRVVRARGAG